MVGEGLSEEVIGVSLSDATARGGAFQTQEEAGAKACRGDMACFKEQEEASVAGPQGVRMGKGREEVGGEARRPGLPSCGKELGFFNYDRKPVESYAEEQAACIFKRFFCLLYGWKMYTIGRSGSQGSSEEEVMVMM